MRKIIAAALVAVPALAGPLAVSQAAQASCVTYPVYSTGPGSCTGGFSTTTNFWSYGGGVGLAGQEVWTWGNGVPSGPDSTATWTISGLTPGRSYEVDAYIPNEHSDATAARYSLYNGADAFQGYGYVDQEAYTNAWATVGDACSNGTISVLVDDSNTSIYQQIGADAVRVVPRSTAC